MADNDQIPDTVSAEAHKRVKDENAALKTQLDEAKNALVDYQKRDEARTFFKDKVTDPDAYADLVTPHLRDVESGKIGDFLAGDRFKPLLANGSPPAPAGEGDGEGEGDGGQPPATPESSTGFGGPSPAGDGGRPVGTQTEKIKVGSPEYQQLLDQGDEAVKKAYDEDRVLQSVRPW